jgi:hypothetical protein
MRLHSISQPLNAIRCYKNKIRGLENRHKLHSHNFKVNAGCVKIGAHVPKLCTIKVYSRRKAKLYIFNWYYCLVMLSFDEMLRLGFGEQWCSSGVPCTSDTSCCNEFICLFRPIFIYYLFNEMFTTATTTSRMEKHWDTWLLSEYIEYHQCIT